MSFAQPIVLRQSRPCAPSSLFQSDCFFERCPARTRAAVGTPQDSRGLFPVRRQQTCVYIGLTMCGLHKSCDQSQARCEMCFECLCQRRGKAGYLDVPADSAAIIIITAEAIIFAASVFDDGFCRCHNVCHYAHIIIAAACPWLPLVASQSGSHGATSQALVSCQIQPARHFILTIVRQTHLYVCNYGT